MNTCHIYAPVGDYECAASLSPSGSGGIPAQHVHPVAPSPEFFEHNTAVARFVLAMPFIMGFIVAAILVAGYVWRF